MACKKRLLGEFLSPQAGQGNKVVGSHGNGELVAIATGKEGNRKGFVLLLWGLVSFVS